MKYAYYLILLLLVASCDAQTQSNNKSMNQEKPNTNKYNELFPNSI